MLLQERVIDYKLLGNAVNFYENMGYEQIEVPWVVSAEASLVTAPINGIFEIDDGKHLVGSAEQGFIELMLEFSDKLKNDKKYMAISPCFRRDIPSEIYSEWFIKLELFCKIKNNNPITMMIEFLKDAETLFTKIHGKRVTNKLSTSMTSFDLMFNAIELGSYGYRKLQQTGDIWVYGTGLALPRAQLSLT